MNKNLSLDVKYKKALDLINKSKTIYIASHERPDGDAIGSMFSMYLLLKSMNKDVKVLMPFVSRRYEFLKELKEAKDKVYEDNYDLLICLDTSDNKRLTITDEDYMKAKKVIAIDHHKQSTIEGNVKIFNDTAPANCEILIDMFKYLNISITKEMSDYLYLGLMTDTGSFNYARTTANTYSAASELIALGADFVTICKKINDTMSESKMKLLCNVIDNMKSYLNGYIRVSIVDLKTLDLLKVDAEDAEGMTNYLRMIEGTEVAIYARQVDDDKYKVSMRSEGNIDLSKIAIKHNGGGHIRAAGFDSYDVKKDINEVINEVERIVESENNRNT